MRRLKRSLALLRAESGAALVEFALLLPLLMMLFGGFLEVGRILQHHHTLEKAMRAATRYLARTDLSAEATARAKNIVLYGTPELVAGTPPRLPYLTDPSAITVVGPVERMATDANGDVVKVQVLRMEAATTYGDFGFLSFVGLSDVPISAAHEEAMIGE